MQAKYINPYTDFGFKKIFGEEASKPLLMEFLNCLLPENNTIENLSFKSTEQLGQTEADRKAIYDIYCESTTGEKFIVELQKAKQNYFIDRTIYYSTFPIREQAQKGEWDYNLKAVFCIGILDFAFDKPKTKEKTVIHQVKLKNQENSIFYEKLTYIYLEMPHFELEERECKTKLEKFLYFLKHLEDFENIPEIFRGEILFEKAFERAEIAKFNQAEIYNYEMSLKVFRDLKNTMDYAIEEATRIGLEKGELKGIEKGKLEGELKGKLEGLKEGKLEIARNLLDILDNETIALKTGLSIIEIKKLREIEEL